MQSKPHIDERTTKVTVRINNELYNRVKRNFHYGQLQALFEQLFLTMDKMIAAGKIMKIVTFIQGKGAVTFKPTEKE